MDNSEAKEDLVLGLDSSTQGIKAVVVGTASLRPAGEWSVNYDSDLPHYGTRGGVHHYKDHQQHGRAMEEGEVTAPPLMWAEALQLLFERMKKSGPENLFARIRAVSASGQQHGSVYWRQGAEATHLARLAHGADGGLVDILKDAFSVTVRPQA